MQNTTKFRDHDLVELLEDLPEYQVRRGEVGVVVEVFDSPNEAFDVEFVDDSGRSSRFAYALKSAQIRRAAS